MAMVVRMKVSRSQFRARARALKLLQLVESSGVRLIVTDRGVPTLEVRRYSAHARAPLEALRGSVLRYDRPADPVENEEWDAVR